MGGGTLDDTEFLIYSPTGDLLRAGQDSGPGNDARDILLAPTTGTYLISVGSGAPNDVGTYTLTSRIDDQPDDVNTFETVFVGSSFAGFAPGRIDSAADQDFFQIFRLAAGTTCVFEVVGGTLIDPTLAIRNLAGGQLAFNDDNGGSRNPRIEFTPTTTTSYIADVGGFGTGTGTYTLQTGFIDDFGDDTVGAASLTIGSSISGIISTESDEDVFRVDLVAGQSYIFESSSPNTFEGWLSLSGSGSLSAFDDDGGPGTSDRIEFTATATGAAFLRVSEGLSVGSFTLSARIDDVADDVETTDTIAAGVSRTGTINSADDQDWWRVSLTAGTTYDFDVQAGTLADPTLALRDGAGTQLAFDDDSGPGSNARLVFTPTVSGNYYLDIDGFSAGIGTYTLIA